jgi:hypothetical protein
MYLSITLGTLVDLNSLTGAKYYLSPRVISSTDAHAPGWFLVHLRVRRQYLQYGL